MKLRLACIKDAVALAKVEQTQSQAAGWGECGFKAELTQTCSCIWCAEEADNIIGFAAARFAVDTAEILNVAVHAQHVHLGIAKQLMEQLLNDLKQRGVKYVSLEVAQDNVPACALYRRVGFAEVNVRKDFYGPQRNGWIMGKAL